ncbi:MAG TPA: hypothetical protein VGD01_12460 [Candidatus Elarobacter sp.]|jgi:hypothetical protein
MFAGVFVVRAVIVVASLVIFAAALWMSSLNGAGRERRLCDAGSGRIHPNAATNAKALELFRTRARSRLSGEIGRYFAASRVDANRATVVLTPDGVAYRRRGKATVVGTQNPRVPLADAVMGAWELAYQDAYGLAPEDVCVFLTLEGTSGAALETRRHIILIGP